MKTIEGKNKADIPILRIFHVVNTIAKIADSITLPI